jgi:ABC-2 type transport system ATP-binding protein
VEVALGEAAPLPPGLPASWLIPEAAGRAIRFVDSAYNEADLGPRIRAVVPRALDVNTSPMSLRQIFITLAKTYRLSGRRA